MIIDDYIMQNKEGFYVKILEEIEPENFSELELTNYKLHYKLLNNRFLHVFFKVS